MIEVIKAGKKRVIKEYFVVGCGMCDCTFKCNFEDLKTVRSLRDYSIVNCPCCGNETMVRDENLRRSEEFIDLEPIVDYKDLEIELAKDIKDCDVALDGIDFMFGIDDEESHFRRIARKLIKLGYRKNPIVSYILQKPIEEEQ